MVVFRRKILKKGILLVVRKHSRYDTYQYTLYRRDGKYVLEASRYYTRLDDCLVEAVIAAYKFKSNKGYKTSNWKWI